MYKQIQQGVTDSSTGTDFSALNIWLNVDKDCFNI